VLEKVIYKRVLTHINNHNILVTEQFGCRSKSSTEKASYNLICEILKDSNNKIIEITNRFAALENVSNLK